MKTILSYILFFQLTIGAYSQVIVTNEDTTHFNLMQQVGNFAEDQRVYYDNENIYTFYKRGHDNNYAYYYFTYGIPSNPSDPVEICFKTSAAYSEKIKEVSNSKNVKTPATPPLGCSKNDSLLIAGYLTHKKIVQSTYVDADDFICLAQDTGTFLGYFIWYFKPLNRTLMFSVSEKDFLPEHLTMQYIYRDKKSPVIIIDQCALGQCLSNFYNLW